MKAVAYGFVAALLVGIAARFGADAIGLSDATGGFFAGWWGCLTYQEVRAGVRSRNGEGMLA